MLAILFGLNLWLGIYLDRGPGDPDEWPWSYLFLIMVTSSSLCTRAGRSLGLDALLRRHVPSVRDGSGFFGKLLNIARLSRERYGSGLPAPAHSPPVASIRPPRPPVPG